MKYETPELVALNAVNRVQSGDSKKCIKPIRDSLNCANESSIAYSDWE